MTQQIDAEHLHVWLTVGRVDARAEVVSRAQRPAARVLAHVIKGRRSADKTGQFTDVTKIDKYCKKKLEMKRSPSVMQDSPSQCFPFVKFVECQ